MSAYLQNIILPGAKTDVVCEALIREHLAAGYSHETGRLLFDYSYGSDEERFFVLANDRCCVVTPANFDPESVNLRVVFADFPALIELWVKGSGWGYRLIESGKWRTGYCSKRDPEDVDEPIARARSDISHLANFCGLPEAARKLRRAEGARHLFSEKGAATFASALDVPLASLMFRDVNFASAGITEERLVAGWRSRLLCFRKQPGATPRNQPTHVTYDEPESIWTKAVASLWIAIPCALVIGLLNWLWLTLTIAMCLFGLLVGWVAILILAGHGKIPFLQKLLFGRAAVDCQNFCRALQASEPARIQIKNGDAINTRHDCSISILPPATISTDSFVSLNHHKAFPFEADGIFNVELNKKFLDCMAYRRPPKDGRRNVQIKETHSLPTAAGTAEYQKREIIFRDKKRYAYQWAIPLPQAFYEFSCHTETELTPEEVETFERIVQSFKQSSAVK